MSPEETQQLQEIHDQVVKFDQRIGGLEIRMEHQEDTCGECRKMLGNRALLSDKDLIRIKMDLYGDGNGHSGFINEVSKSLTEIRTTVRNGVWLIGLIAVAGVPFVTILFSRLLEFLFSGS